MGRREWEIPETASAEHPLQLGQYEGTHQQLRKERQEDYNKMLQVKFHFDPDKNETCIIKGKEKKKSTHKTKAQTNKKMGNQSHCDFVCIKCSE